MTRGNTRLAVISVAAVLAADLASNFPAAAGAGNHDKQSTATPIEHLVVIFQENVSFDHYFATCPKARPTLPARAAPHTPPVNGLTPALLTHHPNAANPARLDRSEALTCDQDHDYTPEQKAFDGAKMDKFVENTQTASCSPPAISKPGDRGQQGGDRGHPHRRPGPTFDDCSTGTTVAMSGPNVGDLLNAKRASWGFFQGGFRPTTSANPATGTKMACARSHTNVGGASVADYSTHYQPFQYYASTANPHHLPPSSAAGIEHTDAANHQYDLTGWYDHQPSPNVNASQSQQDALTASGICGSTATPLAGFQNRCGYGPRLPLLVISPLAKQNFVDHTVTDQTSILRFVEDNWLSGQRIGGGSFDALAGPLTGMFDFPHRHAGNFILDRATGTQG